MSESHEQAQLDPALVESLREQLQNTPVIEAHTCPGWVPLAAWLRASPHPEHAPLAAWLQLALATPGDPPALQKHAKRTLEAMPKLAREVWEGKLDWSWWVGPFVIAYISPGSPSAAELELALGLSASLLLPERTLVDPHPDALALEAESAPMWCFPDLLPGAQDWEHRFIAQVMTERTSDGLIPSSALELSFSRIGPRVPPEPPRGSFTTIALHSGETLEYLHFPYLSQLAGLALHGPPELLERVPPAEGAPHCPLLGPGHDFEARYEALAADAPELIAGLRTELDARPLSEAHTCPSWPVYLDWLLAQGYAKLGEWLQRGLDLAFGRAPDRRKLSAHARAYLNGPHAGERPPDAKRLRDLWRRNDPPRTWLGPFMLAYADPQLYAGLGAHALQASLGVHATFLPHARVYTRLDVDWLGYASPFDDSPLLAPIPMPHASESFALALRAHAELHSTVEAAYAVRIASPGKFMLEQATRSFGTNVGPIAADDESTAILCCNSEDDVLRHAHVWDHLQHFERLILVGTREVLQRWPHGGKWIEPWR